MLSWEDFNSCINSMTNACKNKDFSGVYGVPRGGLCLAVAMSHSLNIPYLEDLKAGCLVVDDVYETGTTLTEISNFPDTTIFVWHSKVVPQWWNAIEISRSDDWLVFPWENIDRSKEDLKAYQASRNDTK